MEYPREEPKPLPPEHVLGFLAALLSLLAAIIALGKSNRDRDQEIS